MSCAAAGGWGPALVGAIVLQACFLLGSVSGPNRVQGRWPDLVLLVGAGVAADVVVVRDSHANAGSLALVIALGFVAALVRQLSRSQRDGLTAQLASTAAALIAVTLPAVLVVLSRTAAGEAVAVTAGLSAAGALLVATWVARLSRHFGAILVPASVVAIGLGLLCAGMQDALSLAQGLAVGVGAALTAGLVRVGRGSGLGALAGEPGVAWWSLPAIWVLPVALLLGRLLIR